MPRPAGMFQRQKMRLMSFIEQNGPVVLTDEELAERLGRSARSVQAYLRVLVRDEEVVVDKRRFKHPHHGWCNHRTIRAKQRF